MNRKHLLITVCLAGVSTADAAWAQTDAPAPVSEVVVTGTRDPTTTEATSTSPLDVVTTRRLTQSGFFDIARGLETLEPEINISHAAAQPTISATRPLTLNGLDPDEVLMLVNGMRYHSSAILNTQTGFGRGTQPYDLNTIPLAAIDHIEVLRDGASAQYGSDAIAGVINVILKSSTTQGFVSAQGGVTGQGDGANGDVAMNKGFKIGDQGFLSVSAEAAIQQATDRAGIDQRYDRKTWWLGNPASQGFNLALNGGSGPLPFGEIYGDALVSYRDTTDKVTFEPPGFSPLYPNGFSPEANLHLFDMQASAGVRGPVGGADFRYDLNNTFGLSDAKFYARNTVNPSLGASSPTSFSDGGPTYWQDTTDLTFTKLMTNATLAFGGQLRYEHYKINDGSAASIYGLGAAGLLGFNPRIPVDNGRTAAAGFADLEVRPTAWFTLDGSGRYDSYSDFGGAWTYKGSGRIAATSWLAFRGSVGTGFRAPSMAQTYYNNVAASGTGVNNTLVSALTAEVSDPVAKALGAAPLKPETSHSYSLGAVLTPIDRLRLTAGVFRTDIDNRIVLSQPLSGALVNAAVANAGIAGVTQVGFFTNAVDTRTTGVNLTAAYSGDLGPSTHYQVSFGYDRNANKITRQATDPVSPTLVYLKTQYQLFLTDVQPADKITADVTLSHGLFTLGLNVTRYGPYTDMPFGTPGPQTFGADTIVNLTASYEFRPGMTATVGVLNLFNIYPTKVQEGTSFSTFGGAYVYPPSSPDGADGMAFFGRLTARF